MKIASAAAMGSLRRPHRTRRADFHAALSGSRLPHLPLHRGPPTIRARAAQQLSAAFGQTVLSTPSGAGGVPARARVSSARRINARCGQPGR